MRAYHFVSTRGFRLEALRFPFPLVWHAERGFHSLCGSERATVNESGRSIHVRMEQLFDVEVIPDHTGAATGWLEVQMPELTSRAAPDWKHLAVILRRSARPGIGLALTQSMFGCPCYAWTVGRVADELGVSRRELQMALFREAYSFAATLRRCRRLNKLLGDSLFQFVGHETHDPRDFAGPAIGKTV